MHNRKSKSANFIQYSKEINGYEYFWLSPLGMRYTFHPLGNYKQKRWTIIRVVKNVEKIGPSNTAGGNVLCTGPKPLKLDVNMWFSLASEIWVKVTCSITDRSLWCQWSGHQIVLPSPGNCESLFMSRGGLYHPRSSEWPWWAEPSLPIGIGLEAWVRSKPLRLNCLLLLHNLTSPDW